MSTYNAGRDLLPSIATLDLRCLLLQDTGYVFDPTHVFVAALTPGTNEVTAAVGYTRITVTGGTRTVDQVLNRTVYSADDPNFGSLTTGQDVVAVVFYAHVTNDADSVVISHKVISPAIDTASIDPFAPSLPDGVIAYLDAA
jgi:hypothetical protein